MSREKIKTLDALVAERRALARAGKRVVFTNGCFDLLHPGHVRYLAHARALGDALVVALNSDRAVRELKGEARPILAEDERAEVMAALEAVTFVTVFDDVSPRDTIVAVAPDVLVKGGDWGLDEIIGREEVEAAGGEVCSLPFVEGCSTTDIVERIGRLARRDGDGHEASGR
jgi:D-glycero-beta-D-manno-heptose 1-phosphate adenylyltransferase